jgi:hypothetical protein
MRRLLAPVHAYVQRRVDAGVLAQLGAPRRPGDGARSRHRSDRFQPETTQLLDVAGSGSGIESRSSKPAGL